MTAFNITTLPTGTITLTLDFAVRERQSGGAPHAPYDWVATFRDIDMDGIESDRYFQTVQEAVDNARKRFGASEEES